MPGDPTISEVALGESGLGPDAIPYADRPIGPVAEQLLHDPAGRLAAHLPPVDNDLHVREETLHLEGAAALLRARRRDVPDGRKHQQRRDQDRQHGSDPE